MTRRILVSNDDGINHPALWALVKAVSDLGEVIVSAPDRNCSGVGTAMTLHNPVRANEVPGHVEGVKAFAVQGTPGDSVVLGIRELVDGPIDAVISGINPGNNVTTNVLVSGTLGAAYAGHLNGVPAMAVSMGFGVDPSHRLVQEGTRAAVETLLNNGGPALVNLNFPWEEDWPIKGAKVTFPAPRILEDKTRSDSTGPDNYYWIHRGLIDGAEFNTLPPDCDVAVLREGFMSVTSMTWPIDASRDQPLMQEIAAAIEKAIL